MNIMGWDVFGGFQEIREKKALAYAFAVRTSAKDTTKPQYAYGYLGTQAKTIEAIESMVKTLGNVPKDSVKFAHSVSSKKQQLALTELQDQLFQVWLLKS